jgi:GDP-mannose 6-dehydrogenase
MKVALFGLGYVGSVTATCLAARGHRVAGIDIATDKVEALAAGRPSVLEPGLDALVVEAVGSGALRATVSTQYGLAGSDLSIVCVGTPSAPNGSTDLSQVTRVVAEIGTALAGSNRAHTVVIRSTVPPGTVDDVVVPLLEQASGRTVGEDLQVAMCPEFLREGSSITDFFDPPFLVIGGTERAAAAVAELFGFLDCPVHVVATRSAESIKYACNAFHALKVAFVNELSQLYRRQGVDARQVMEVFVDDHRLNISPAYLRPGFAFGGSCLPKDLRSLLHLGRMASQDLPLLGAALATNDMLIRSVADRVIEAVDAAGGTNRRVALLGLSFKENTDDLRESPYVALAEILIGKGMDVRIHDRFVNPGRLSGANLRHVEARLPHLRRVLCAEPADALAGAHVAVVAVGGSEVAEALLVDPPPTVLDLDGRLGTPVEALAGYTGVGW